MNRIMIALLISILSSSINVYAQPSPLLLDLDIANRVYKALKDEYQILLENVPMGSEWKVEIVSEDIFSENSPEYKSRRSRADKVEFKIKIPRHETDFCEWLDGPLMAWLNDNRPASSVPDSEIIEILEIWNFQPTYNQFEDMIGTSDLIVERYVNDRSNDGRTERDPCQSSRSIKGRIWVEFTSEGILFHPYFDYVGKIGNTTVREYNGEGKLINTFSDHCEGDPNHALYVADMLDTTLIPYEEGKYTFVDRDRVTIDSKERMTLTLRLKQTKPREPIPDIPDDCIDCEDNNPCTLDQYSPIFSICTHNADNPIFVDSDNTDCFSETCINGVLHTIPNNNEIPIQGPDNDCYREICLGGIVSVPDDTEIPPQISPNDCLKQVCRGGDIIDIQSDSELGCNP